jgi:hypothetical protein
MRAALRAGRQTAEAKQPPDNPFTGQEPRDRVLAVMWRIGYQAGNPIREE